MGEDMTIPIASQQPRALKMRATFRRFIHWLTKPQVVLSLIMLALMFYMIIIPLYRMVEITLTWQLHDLTRVPDAVVGELTIFHYTRMLTGKLGKIFMYTPLQHSFPGQKSHPF